MEDLNAKFQQLGYSKSSADLFETTIQNFISKNYPKNPNIIEKPISRIRKLFLIPNLNTRRNTAKAFMLAQKVLDLPAYDKSNKYYRKVYAMAMKERKEQKREVVDTTEYDKKKEEIEQEYSKALEEADTQAILSILPTIILMRLMTEYPTRRANDYRTLHIKKPTDANKKNYYSNGKVYFNDFKGKDSADITLFKQRPITQFFKKTKEGVVFTLDKDMRELFNMLRKIDRSRVYLIEQGRKPYAQPAFSKWITRNFGITVNDFRKMYVQKNVDSKAIDNAKQVAKDMSNSLTTQQTDYRERD